MIAARLLKRIEENWEQIASAVMRARDRDPHLSHYRNLSDDEIRDRIRDLTANLGAWLMAKDEARLTEHFESLGRRRYEQGLPLHDVIQKLMVLKREIRGFVSDQNLGLTPVEIYDELEMLRAMAGYFDFVIFRVAKGYEEALRANRDWDPGRFRLRVQRPLPAI